MTRRTASPAKPWARATARARSISPDQAWGLRIARRILADCHPWQRDAVIDPASRISLLVGRGGAKTTSMRARALIKLVLLPRQYVGYAATSADHARELNWDRLPQLCESYGITTTGTNPDVSFKDTKMILRCNRTGSVYRLRGVEDRRDANRFRGFSQAEFQADECGAIPHELLDYLVEECVAQRLGEALAIPPGVLDRIAAARSDEELDDLAFEPVRRGCVVLGSTPPNVLAGPFYEATRDGSDVHRPYSKRDAPEYANWLGYSSHAWTLKDVVDLPRASELYPALVANWEEQLRQKTQKGWGDDHPIWMRESLGRWAENNTATVFRYRPHVDGVEWNRWNPLGEKKLDEMQPLEVLQLAIAALPKDVGEWHYVLEMDSGGTRDPFACNVFAFAPSDPQRRFIHVFAFERMRMHPRTIAELLLGEGLDADKPTGVLGLIGWPDATTFDSDQPQIDELGNVYGIRCRKADRKAEYKFGAIEIVNGDMVEGRIKILEGSPLEKQAQTLQWKPDEFGILRENKAQPNHSTDCLIYGRRDVANLFDTGRVEHDRPAQGAQAPDPRVESGARNRRGEDDDDFMRSDLDDEFDGGSWAL